MPQDFPNSRVTFLDLTKATDPRDPGLVEFVGGFTDRKGNGYFVPGGASGKFVKVSLANFPRGPVTVLNLTEIDPQLKCFEGGFADAAGEYGYLVPFGCGGGPGISGKVVRVKLSEFTKSAVTWLNLAEADPALIGFDGGFTDGHLRLLCALS